LLRCLRLSCLLGLRFLQSCTLGLLLGGLLRRRLLRSLLRRLLLRSLRRSSLGSLLARSFLRSLLSGRLLRCGLLRCCGLLAGLLLRCCLCYLLFRNSVGLGFLGSFPLRLQLCLLASKLLCRLFAGLFLDRFEPCRLFGFRFLSSCLLSPQLCFLASKLLCRFFACLFLDRFEPSCLFRRSLARCLLLCSPCSCRLRSLLFRSLLGRTLLCPLLSSLFLRDRFR